MRRHGHDEAHGQQARSRGAQPCDEARARVQADDTDEHGETDGVEDPQRRLRDAAEGRPHGPQPSEDEPHDEGAAAGGEAERQAAHGDGQQPDEPSDQDAEADEHDVGFARRPFDVAQHLADAVDVRRSTREAQQVASVHGRLGREGDLLAAADQLHENDPTAVLLGERRQRLVGDCATGDHDVGRHQGDVQQRLVIDLVAERAALADDHVAPCGHGDDIALVQRGLGRRLDNRLAPANPADEDPLRGKRRLQFADTLIRKRVGEADCPDGPFPVGRLRAGIHLLSRGHSLLELPGLRLQIDPKQSRREARQEPHDEARPDQVAHRVGDGDVVQQARLLGFRQLQPVDRVARCTDDRGLGEGTGHEARRGAGVVSHELGAGDGRQQAGHAQDDRQRHLAHRTLLETPEELRTDLVAGREQEQVEKDDLDERMDGNVELSDHHAGQQRPHDVAEGEGPEPHAPDQESERERQEDRQLGIVPQC